MEEDIEAVCLILRACARTPDRTKALHRDRHVRHPGFSAAWLPRWAQARFRGVRTGNVSGGCRVNRPEEIAGQVPVVVTGRTRPNTGVEVQPRVRES